MNVYQSKFAVRAAKITDISRAPDHWTLWFAEEAGEHTDVGLDWAERHVPQIGGWFVLHEDGLSSFVPDAAFAADYARV
jgi:hypothetical protein